MPAAGLPFEVRRFFHSPFAAPRSPLPHLPYPFFIIFAQNFYKRLILKYYACY
jgi:hypothetical protein